MTEDEAGKKWCPMVRSVAALEDDSGALSCEAQGGFNRISVQGDNGVNFPHGTYCIASDCACWVWEEHQGREVMTKDGRQGHCGLIK